MISFLKTPKEETECFFLTHTFTHAGIFYKVAIAEELAPTGEATGSYVILLQCEQGTEVILLFKDDDRWFQQSKVGNKDMVRVIGSIIDGVCR